MATSRSGGSPRLERCVLSRDAGAGSTVSAAKSCTIEGPTE
ncbi:hypothetical protein AB0M80_41445 [Amycolatopsis sp. NPDC051045]